MNITLLQLAITLPVRLRRWVMALLCSTNFAIADSDEAIDQSAIEETSNLAPEQLASAAARIEQRIGTVAENATFSLR